MTDFDCKDINALLSGIIDDELDSPTRHQTERHLAACTSCRDLVNQTESLNDLIALDAQRLAFSGGLPPGFEEAVLGRTIFAEAYQFAGRKWTSWLGWVAAAACLGLAVSMWFVRAVPITPINIASNPTRIPIDSSSRANFYQTDQRSWTYDGGLSPEALQAVALAKSGGSSSMVVNTPFNRAIDDSVVITQADADTLYAASNLLEMLKNADLRSFADVERIRQIAEYDELLDKLADSRERLSAADRAPVMAAEGVLLRVVNGPLNLEDLRVLNDTVATMDLPAQIEAISTRWQPASSL